MADALSPKRQEILDFITSETRRRTYPPTIREIGQAVGLNSPATVKRHLEVLIEAGHLAVDPQRPRTITVIGDLNRVDPQAGTRSVPLLGQVAAGTGVLADETDFEEVILPEMLVGKDDNFILTVRGDSMIEAGILDGDMVVVNRQKTARTGEIVVAGINDDEATVKYYFPQGARTILRPANSTMAPMDFPTNDVVIFGRVVGVMRRY
jgi:repressor LexA